VTGDEHIQTELNLSKAATMNDVNENGEIEGAKVYEGVSCCVMLLVFVLRMF